MCKVFSVLVLFILINQLGSTSEKEYYQYVINDDSRVPCVADGNCFKDENESFVLDKEDEVENEEELDEDTLYDEEVDVVPYDVLNDALQEVNAQKNLFKSMKTRKGRNIHPNTKSVYNDIEDVYRKYLNRDIPQEDELTETNIRPNNFIQRDSMDHYHSQYYGLNSKDESAETNENSDSEFYNSGVTRNDLLERKKLELLRNTFTEEKLGLLETDKFLHEIISNLGELENYEFDDAETVSVDNNDSEPEIDKPSYDNLSQELKNLYEPEERTQYNTNKLCPDKDNPSPSDYQREINKEYDDFDEAEISNIYSPDDGGEELNTDFEDLDSTEVESVESEPNVYVSEEEKENDGTEVLKAKNILADEIVEDPQVGEVDNSKEKFVITKKQYEVFLKNKLLQAKCNQENELNPDQPGVYKIETETSKFKRKVSKDNQLHHFEIPKFEDIPKVHELPDHHVEKLWDEYKKKYKKDYRKKATDSKKKLHWQSNHKKIHTHNQEAQQGLHGYTLRENHLSDLHPRHYIKEMTRLTHSRIRRTLVRSPESNESVLIPDHLDWREKGFITPDWNQEDCGACYAFSIASAIQGQIFKSTSEIEELSIQQVVDCSIISGNLGCAGGSLRNTLNYVQFAGGLMKEEDYPYKGKQSICKFKRPNIVVDISSWSVLPPQDEHALKVTLATVGPIAVSINASPHTFQLYASGIYDDEACTSDYVNHAMLLVGYTRNSWILKNWWSHHWGDNGYMYLKRGNNRCGIANYAVYALI
ncbi:trophozoite cysteine proteinase-like isoform X4 [Diaphorina citri]|uniref:Trophozoite cysteine proteinase-like isoform X1 n=1 Tax=Diaphorina citri TaxID=121845 RepID=A0A1S4ECC8_DIACI|nr:trophozoite cysteine proteinase-like isoform X2 [Diaphorina citri]XP_017299881.1 trophozoite cysteine proteinase-like isoform X1 [Diaphorina citri]XP_026679974.1 trophozoite cysteine proteinase-like isoform X3 [Diaphorina citri]XP_026679975.1 trophozoite cysteine proteinase-like isoform X4 [Diaphorina citri]KAI5731792.1 hypothetical protein M8J77_016031 [Diaphorina citri]